MNYWYCPYCEEEVDNSRVTHQELHDSCGHAVIEVESVQETIFDEIREERKRQTEKRGEQNLEMESKMIPKSWLSELLEKTREEQTVGSFIGRSM
jgi:hypothetical protein